MRYQFYYWPSIQGRGEFVRLALEEVGAAYVDVGRETDGGGIPELIRFLDGEIIARPPFAPPYLRAGKLLIGQTANILMFLGPRPPPGTRQRGGAAVGQPTATDTSPIWSRKRMTPTIRSPARFTTRSSAAKRRQRAADFVTRRIPKYLGHFERALAKSGEVGYFDRQASRLSRSFSVPGSRRTSLCVAAGNGAGRKRMSASSGLARSRCFATPRGRLLAVRAPDSVQGDDGIFRHYQELDVPS